MARSGIRDPLDKFRCVVDVPGFSKLGFSQCGVPKYNITAKEYAEGGAHLNPKSIIDKVSYVPVRLSRGVTNDTSFAKWASAAWDLVNNNAAMNNSDSDFGSSPFGMVQSAISTFQSNGAQVVPSESAYPFNYRKKVKIEHVNRAGQTEVIYVLYNAYPIGYEPASDFDALADDGLSIETLVLAYEGFEIKYTGVAGAVANIVTGLI